MQHHKKRKRKNYWHELLVRCEGKMIDSLRYFDDIIVAYSQKHRFYHNLHHIDHFFEQLDFYQSESGEGVKDELYWATWYHDFVYKPGAKTNEKKSAEKARIVMQDLAIERPIIVRTCQLILATQQHQANTNDLEQQVFLDADMAILGSEPEDYEQYCKAIKQEHAHIPKFLFNRGRAKFLSSTLSQPSIFLSPFFQEQYEQAARKNLETELLSLG